MIEQVARFEKVSYNQFRADYLRLNGKDSTGKAEEEDLTKVYNNIKLPVRATAGSAGYDFFMPDHARLVVNKNTMFPTGIRCRIEPGWVLMLFPKSGLGSKYGMRLLNTVGIVDSDYYGAANEGHIMACITVGRDLEIAAGDKFMQGVFVPFGVTKEDNTDTARIGGFGSTGA